METIYIKEHVYGDGNVPFPISSLTGGTMSGSVQIGVAGSESPYGMTITFTFAANTHVPAPLESASEASAVAKKFHRLCKQWRKETRHQSSVSRMAMHPAYQQIIGMGQDAVPFILRELKRTRGHWLWALFAITGEDLAPEGSTFAEAVNAWLRWGIQHGYAALD